MLSALISTAAVFPAALCRVSGGGRGSGFLISSSESSEAAEAVSRFLQAPADDYAQMCDSS